MKFDVVIIGAGPSGLTLACALANTKLKICIIEKGTKNKFSNPKSDGRDIALTHKSIDILREIGIWKNINKKIISRVKEARVLDGNSSSFLHFDHSKTVENSLGSLVSNQIIRKAIYKKINTFKRLKFFTKSEVTKIFSNKSASKIYLKNGKIIESKLAVIADGRLSKIREKLGIHANKTIFGTSMTVFRMKHKLDNYNIASEYFQYSQTLAVLPIKKNLSSIVITLPNYQSKKFLSLSNKEINKKIQNDLKSSLGKMILIGKKYSYPMVTIYANEFYRDRTILIGDAAVGMHPITAHGFNLNLSGVNIIENEIKYALSKNNDIGEENVLKRYDRKFRMLSLPIYLATNGIVRLYTNQKPMFKLARKSLLHLANVMKPAKNVIIDRLLLNNS